MRLCLVLPIAFLLSGNVYGLDREATVNEGESYTFTVLTTIYDVDMCYLKNPSGELIQFAPGDQSASTDKFVVGEGNSMARCEIMLTNADANDHGSWEMYFTYDGETGSSQIFFISVVLNANDDIQNDIQNDNQNDIQNETQNDNQNDIQNETQNDTQYDISITEGADLYLHLNFQVALPSTCTIYGPDGVEFSAAEVDPMYTTTCAFIVRRVTQSHAGQWILEYGTDQQRSSVNVNVLAAQTVTVGNLRWIVGTSVDMIVGPADAVYCKLEDPLKHVVYDNFGPCRAVINRVAHDHIGLWHMQVAVPGTVLTQNVAFYVFSQEETSVVTTAFQRIAPSVVISCTVPSEYEVTSCSFRGPHGNTYVAAHGVGQEGIMFNGTVINNYESSADSHDCTLRLLTPGVADLGIWRCAMQTTTGTYYGFITVVCPFLMSDEQVAQQVVTEPVLNSVAEIRYDEDEPVVMSCNIPSALRYCYFRTSNGTVYNVFPTMSSSLHYEYVGAGLDSGDCGIRFKQGLAAAEGGTWSCHVGLVDSTAEEQRSSFTVDILAKMEVKFYWQQADTAVVEILANPHYTVEYCRFIRMDGHGFTWETVPSQYELHKGDCALIMKNPSILDLHPWTVAVKFVGMAGEVSMSTSENMLAHLMNPVGGDKNPIGQLWFWLVMIFIGVVVTLTAFALIPKKNREWTYRRAGGVRTSFRSSWDRTFNAPPIPEKQPPVPAERV